MDDKQLNEIEAGYIAIKLRLLKHSPNSCEFNDALCDMADCLRDIPALIQAIRDSKPDCNCELMVDIHNKFVEEIAALEQAIRDRDTKIIQLEDGIAAAVTDMDIMRAEKRERDMEVAELEEQAEKDLNTIYELGEQCDSQE